MLGAVRQGDISGAGIYQIGRYLAYRRSFISSVKPHDDSTGIGWAAHIPAWKRITPSDQGQEQIDLLFG